MEIRKVFTPFIMLLFFAMPNAFAQQSSSIEEKEKNEKIEAARIAHITSKLSLSPEQAQKFWPVYNEFSAKRESLRKQHRQVMHSVRGKETSNEEAQQVIKTHLRMEKEEAELADEYYGKKLQAVLESRQILKLMQAEHEFKKILLQQLKERNAQ